MYKKLTKKNNPNAIKSLLFDDFFGFPIYIDIMDDCGENEGGCYCRIYNNKRLVFDNNNCYPIDYGDYFDDFCIYAGDCDFSNTSIIKFIIDYLKNNFSAKDLA